MTSPDTHAAMIRAAKAALSESEDAVRLLDMLLQTLAQKLPDADLYQLRCARDFAECAAVICREAIIATLQETGQ